MIKYLIVAVFVLTISIVVFFSTSVTFSDTNVGLELSRIEILISNEKGGGNIFCCTDT